MKYSQLQFCKSYSKKYLLTLEKGYIINHSTEKAFLQGGKLKLLKYIAFWSSGLI